VGVHAAYRISFVHLHFHCCLCSGMGMVALPFALLTAVVSGLSQTPQSLPLAIELNAARSYDSFYEAAAEGGMPREDAERLLAGILKASEQKGMFLVTVLDGGMLSMGENMILSLNAVPCDTPLLVVGLGGNVCSSFLDFGGTADMRRGLQDVSRF
ncbi:unnamed protein product, partial [Prorocentrum cordatum]